MVAQPAPLRGEGQRPYGPSLRPRAGGSRLIAALELAGERYCLPSVELARLLEDVLNATVPGKLRDVPMELHEQRRKAEAHFNSWDRGHRAAGNEFAKSCPGDITETQTLPFRESLNIFVKIALNAYRELGHLRASPSRKPSSCLPVEVFGGAQDLLLRVGQLVKRIVGCGHRSESFVSQAL